MTRAGRCGSSRHMRRRQFIAILGGAAAWPFAVRAQQATQGRQVRVGLIASVAPPAASMTAFRNELRERGYVEGENLYIDVRWPRGSFAQNPDLAIELVRGNPNVIVAWGTSAVMAARRATATIPIVMASVSDPVETGLIKSLARPGGNITGVSVMNNDLSAKLTTLLVEIVPGLSRLAHV